MEQANAFLAGLGLGTTAPATTTPPAADATPPVSGTAPTERDPNVVPPAAAPPVNPPEAAGKKGKGRAPAATGLSAGDIDAIAEAVADKLALRLVRNVP